MFGINKVILVGHLGKDPELRKVNDDVSVASFPLVTNEMTMKDGRRVEQVEWHNIVVWRALADMAAKLLTKGKLIYLEGKLRTRNFEDSAGTRKTTTEIVGESFTILGRPSDFRNPEHEQNKENNASVWTD